MKQWPYFSVIDDLLGGDPSVQAIAVETCPIPMGMLQFISTGTVYCLPELYCIMLKMSVYVLFVWLFRVIACMVICRKCVVGCVWTTIGKVER